MNNVLFLSSILPYTENDYYKTNSIGAISNANDNFQKALVSGLVKNNCNIKILNVPNVGAYPLRFTKINLKNSKLDINDNAKGESIGFLNILLLKHISIYYHLRKKILKEDLPEFDFVLVYDLYPPFISVLADIKRLSPNIKIINVIPDIYGMTRDSTNILNKLLDKINYKILVNNLPNVDGFVYLTEIMKDVMPETVSQVPYMIMEGLIDLKTSSVESISTTHKRFILYTGSLDLRHGILKLIDAFIDAKLKDLNLIICGDGGGRVVVEERIKSHGNINYIGQVSREKALRLQREAFLLVNPRTSDGEFTKYSFPSKIMEYFISGTPTLMYKLDGIPSEYYKHCFTVENEDTKALTHKLIEVSKYDKVIMDTIAKQARDFIFNNKNSFAQTKRLVNFFNTL